jgi:hypothetical protein
MAPSNQYFGALDSQIGLLIFKKLNQTRVIGGGGCVPITLILNISTFSKSINLHFFKVTDVGIGGLA